MLLVFTATVIPAATPVYAQGGDLQTVTIQPDAAGMKDVVLFENNGQWGNHYEMGVGQNSAVGFLQRSLLEFDLSGLPRDLEVVSATVTLTIRTDYSSNARTMYVYAMNTDWTEGGATWTGSGSHAWQTAGAIGTDDAIATPIGSVSMADNLTDGTKVSFTLDLASVKEMVKENYFGFKLQMDVESNDAYTFYTSDDATSDNHPKIVIEYYPGVDNFSDPGWVCVPFSGIACDVTLPMSPYTKSGNGDVMAIYNQEKGMTAAKLLCEPFPRCINDYPIYYRVEYNASWHSDGGGTVLVHYGVTLSIPGGTPVYYDVQCDDRDYTGNCIGVFEGEIPVNTLPSNYDGGYTVGFTEGMNTSADRPTWGSAEWSVYLSLVPFDENCSDLYAVPVPETFTIDPVLEAPLGIDGVPADSQIYTTVVDAIYMVKVQGGPWNDGATDRTDAAVSFDGVTWMPWEEFSINALCVDVDPYAPDDPNFRVIYFTATTDTFYIRVNDTTAAFADNTSTPDYQFVIGWSYLLPVPPSCEAQFSYNASFDNVASILLPSTDDDAPANNELTEPLEAGAWYGIQVANGTWHETGASDLRVDLEFKFTTGGGLGGTEWADLAEGSNLVYCTSTDGNTVFVQAPAQSGLVLHLRVNDQDIPQNFIDNIGTLGINIVHATFTRIESGCELQFDVGELVYHDTVAANAGNGKAFATSFASQDLGITYSYGLTPGAWYVLDTTDGPWWQTYTGGGYTVNTYYYDVKVKSGVGGTWQTLEEWGDCVVPLDAFGHKRVYFQVPADGGVEYYIRVGGSNPFGRGEMGWNLYQGVDISPPGGTIDGCQDFIYDPDVVNGGGEIDSRLSEGSHILGLETNTYSAIQIESANVASDPPEYKDSGWVESSGGTESDELQITLDGTNWSTLPNHPGVLCYFYTPVDHELVFIIQTLNGQS